MKRLLAGNNFESSLTYSGFQLVAWRLHTVQQCLFYNKSEITSMEAIYCIHSFTDLKIVEILNHYLVVNFKPLFVSTKRITPFSSTLCVFCFSGRELMRIMLTH